MTPNEPLNPLQDDAPPGDPAAPTPQGADQQLRRLVSRRALVRAGWTVPVVLTLHLPVNAFAQSGGPCPTAHSDTPFSDTGVGATHVDIGHIDVCT